MLVGTTAAHMAESKALLEVRRSAHEGQRIESFIVVQVQDLEAGGQAVGARRLFDCVLAQAAGLGHVDTLRYGSVGDCAQAWETSYAGPDGIVGLFEFVAVCEVQCLGALGHEILGFAVYQTDEGALDIQPPGDELGMRGENRVRGGEASDGDGALVRLEVLVELPCAGGVGGGGGGLGWMMGPHLLGDVGGFYSRAAVGDPWPVSTSRRRENQWTSRASTPLRPGWRYLSRSSGWLRPVWKAIATGTSPSPSAPVVRHHHCLLVAWAYSVRRRAQACDPRTLIHAQPSMAAAP